VRTVAAARAAAVGIRDPEPLCAWLWTPTGWTPHRYAVWLDYAQEATDQLATAKTRAFTWPSRTDLFELAVFRGKADRVTAGATGRRVDGKAECHRDRRMDLV